MKDVAAGHVEAVVGGFEVGYADGAGGCGGAGGGYLIDVFF